MYFYFPKGGQSVDFYLLGQKIRDLRTLHHFSQADLAELIDVSTNYIGHIERGDRKPSIEALATICNVLGTSMDYILSDSLTTTEDQLICNIISKLQDLSIDEKTFFYSTIVNYSQLKKKQTSNN